MARFQHDLFRPDFTPSPQQHDFLKVIYQDPRQGSILLKAGAGCGKSTTVLEGTRRMAGSTILLAFNNRIVKELRAKAVKIDASRFDLNIATFHSEGARAWVKAYPASQLKEHKVRDIVDGVERKNPQVKDYNNFICKMVSFAKQLLAYDINQWWDIYERFNVGECLPEGTDVARVMALAMRVFERSNDTCHLVYDFDDMLFAPIHHKVAMRKYNNIVIDEAQDTNPARRQMVAKLMTTGSRVFAVGDDRQAIYGFTGADANALDLIRQQFNCIVMPLTVTYRCPKAVVKYANQWMPDLEAHPSAPEGVLSEYAPRADREWFEDLRPASGDAILCRYTRPLVSTAYSLLRHDIPCRIEGRDIGKGLVALIKQLHPSNLEALDLKLDAWERTQVKKAEEKRNDRRVQEVQDKAGAIRVIIDKQAEGASVRDVITAIETLFADGVEGTLVLSTIHKSKGREWQRVFWLFTQIRKDGAPDDVDSEECCAGVAATRAMQELHVIPEAAHTKG